MADLFYAGAYWGPRAESASQCAQRLARCLTGLGAAHPVLATWFRKGRSRSAATASPVAVGEDALAALLAGGRNRTDVGGEVIDELGFNVGMWNGNEVAVSFSTTCGAAPTTGNVLNYATLELPAPTAAATALYQPATARAIFAAIVQSWQPQWATFASYAMREAQDTAPRRPVAGWLTYLRQPPASLAAPGPGVAVEDLAGGALLVAGPDPLHVSGASLSAAAGLVA